MFNLLIGGLWEAGRQTMLTVRLFEYTDDEIITQFKDNDKVLFDNLGNLPCLFVAEGMGNQLARAGSITRARIVGREISFDCAFEPDIPPLLNSTIAARAMEFGISNEFEFSRTHWAVKDVDLYRVLLRNFQPRRQRPRVFTIPEHENIEPVLVSAMMPFDAEFAAVYHSLKDTAEKVGLRCRRADDLWENPAIIQDVVSLIDRSRVVICDCTGRNPNVFYEIGIAHTLGREVILITQADADIPFDLRHLRYVRYLNNAEGRQALCAALETRLTTLLANP